MSAPKRLSTIISYSWEKIELPIYYGIGITLVVAAVGALGQVWVKEIYGWVTGAVQLDVLEILDKLLLISMLTEILQMIKISINQRRLSSEPFLIVGLISVVRRILIITAKGTQVVNVIKTEAFFGMMAELFILALLLTAFVWGIYRLRQQRLNEIRKLRQEKREYNDTPSWSQLLSRE